MNGVMPGVMGGKRGLIMGVANSHSIAWGVAQALGAQGAEMAFTYQGDTFERRVRPLAESLGAAHIMDADVQSADSLDAVFGELKDAWGTIDFLVHAIAYSDKAELTGRYADTSRGNFLNTLDISCYSFVDVTRRAAELMRESSLHPSPIPAPPRCFRAPHTGPSPLRGTDHLKTRGRTLGPLPAASRCGLAR